MDKYTYRVTWVEEDEEFVGLCVEFPSLSFLDTSSDKAFQGIRKLVAEVVADMHNQGEKVPEPLALKKYSGKYSLRMTTALHKELTIVAAEEKVSLNRFINDRLAASV